MPRIKREWYDVCDDYSLEVRTCGMPNLKDCKWSKHIEDLDGVAFGEFGEVWYFLGPVDLNGVSLEEYDLDEGEWE
jgi:hypothetical protein